MKKAQKKIAQYEREIDEKTQLLENLLSSQSRNEIGIQMAVSILEADINRLSDMIEATDCFIDLIERA